MSASAGQTRERISQQAADWFVANRAGLAGNERDEFITWIKASPIHIEEYLALAVIARDLRSACAESAGSLETLLTRARLESSASVVPLSRSVESAPEHMARRPWLTAAVSLVALGILSFGLVQFWTQRTAHPVPVPTNAAVWQFETQHGELLSRRLPDGSQLHLNTDSRVVVRYDNKERLVALTSGEADFEVVHEPKRAFRVRGGSFEVVAIGTNFNVRLEAHSATVSVLHGRVTVMPTGPAGAAASGPASERLLTLDAGQQIKLTAGQWPPSGPVRMDAERSTAWLHRQIKFENEPLERVAIEFNRYATKPIEITTPALRSLEISGVFATDDVDAFVAFLRSLDGVRVDVTSSQIRVSQD
jgi:transmembrane sensor